MLARQAAAAVGVGTCWPRETAATLPSARRRKALRRPRGGGAGHIVAAARLHLYNNANIDCRREQWQDVLHRGAYHMRPKITPKALIFPEDLYARGKYEG